MKDSHIIIGFVILGAAVINLYLSPPAPRSSQTADAAVSQTTSGTASSEAAATGSDCEGASSPLVPAVAPPCPVMNMKVATKSYKSSYNGKTYYFCCADCKPKFDASPAVYVPSVVRSGGSTS